MVPITFKHIVHRVYYWLEYMFVPPRCSFCLEDCMSGQVLCSVCLQRMAPIVSHTLSITKTYNVRVFALSAYVNPVRELILAKHGSHRRASVVLGKLMVQQFSHIDIKFDIVVPVPLHWTRYARRGYNQAAVMGAVIAQARGSVCKELLRRNKMTGYQAGLAPVERITNMHDAFTIDARLAAAYQGKHILLVDDVMTTGITLIEAVKKLRTINPASITVMVAARVV